MQEAQCVVQSSCEVCKELHVVCKELCGVQGAPCSVQEVLCVVQSSCEVCKELHVVRKELGGCMECRELHATNMDLKQNTGTETYNNKHELKTKHRHIQQQTWIILYSEPSTQQCLH